MEIKGYKAFFNNKTNRGGESFEVGDKKHKDGVISTGNNGNGYHMCKHLSDVFRFYDFNNCEVAEVIGSGNIVEYEMEDWNPGYYEMYSVSDLEVIRFLSREEILQTITKSEQDDVLKFLCTAEITPQEGLIFLSLFRNNPLVCKNILYYVFKREKAFLYSKFEREDVVKKVLLYGQNNCQGSKGKQS